MLQEQLLEKIKGAMKDRNAERLEVLRGLNAAIKDKQIEMGRGDFADEDFLTVVQSEIKKRKDAISLYSDAGRDELVAQEQAEIEVLTEFLPEQFSDDKIKEIIEVIHSEMPDAVMGQLIGAVKQKVGQQAEGARVAQLVKEHMNQ
jgi:uncharacterized protein YqeY